MQQPQYPNAPIAPSAPIYAPNIPPQSFQPPHQMPPYQQMQQVQFNYTHAQPGSSAKKGTPTVTLVENFDASRDAQILRKAMKGFGTDEDALISVICRRPDVQRQQICRAFKQSYGKDLIEDVKSETRGNFENLLVALLTPLMEFYAKEIHDAIAGFGTDEDVLIEVLCCLSNHEIHEIKHCFYRMYGQQLEHWLMGDTSGHFKRLLVSLCNANRDETGVTNPQNARIDAQELINAGVARFGTDESTFNRILCQRNFEQLRLVCDEYQKLAGHSLESAIKKEFSGDIEDGLLAIVHCVKDKAEFFAKRLHKSMAGLGTNDRQLIRLVVTRCEVDMADIKVAFERKYGKSLKSFIKGDTSGDYKHALFALIGESR
jgi:annexin A7/11